jgi:hypothetical protein
MTAPNPAELFERRLDFLNLCPAPDMPSDVCPMLARYGATGQPAALVSRLNAQIHACEMRDPDDAGTCRPTGNEWRETPAIRSERGADGRGRFRQASAR